MSVRSWCIQRKLLSTVSFMLIGVGLVARVIENGTEDHAAIFDFPYLILRFQYAQKFPDSEYMTLGCLCAEEQVVNQPQEGKH